MQNPPTRRNFLRTSAAGILTAGLGTLAPRQWAAAGDTEADFTPIFDGKTLNGWDGDPKFWRVEDGALTGQTTKENPLKKNTFLIWRGGTVGDFELKLEYRIKGGNSGIQYRGWEDPPKHGKWVISGYQADVDSIVDRGWCGCLYEENGRGFLAHPGQKTVIGDDHKPVVVAQVADAKKIQSHLKFEDWNRYHIIAKGYHFIHKINGQVTAEATDEDKTKRRARGLLAFQLHQGEPMKLEIRGVRLKRHD